jgi:hypothetical protein
MARVGLAALGVFLGCSSSSGGAGTASGFAQQYCALFAPCCADAGLGTNTQTCAELLTSLGMGYNAANGQACLDAATQASKQPGFCSGMSMSLPACSDVFSSSTQSSGQAQPGQTCKLDTDCAPAAGGGATCLGGTFSSDGGFGASQCVQTTPGMAGQGPCVGNVNGDTTSYSWSGSTAPPAHGYTCNFADGITCSYTTQLCTALAPTGQACSSDTDCVTADYCNFSGAGATCAPRLPDGSSCAMSFSACMKTSYCDSTSQTCKPALPAGAACGSGVTAPCQSNVCVNGKCGSSSSAGLSLVCG